MIKQGVLEIFKSRIYDTVFLPENVRLGQARAFTIPYGQYAGRVLKQKTETNMQICGMLPAPEKFVIERLCCALRDGCGYIGTANRWWDGVIELETCGKRIIGGALRDFDDQKLLKRIHEERIPFDREMNYEDLATHGDMLLDQCQPFSCSIHFDHEVNVPMELVIALEGIHLVAVW